LSFCAVISAMAGELFMARWMASLAASWLYLTILALSLAAGWMKTPQTITRSIGVWSTVRVQDFSPHPGRVAG
jgi:hypothetical protein